MATATAPTPVAQQFGENVTVTIKGDVATIEIDLSKRFGLSPSGKTVRVASTEGNVKITDEVTLGLNCYVKA